MFRQSQYFWYPKDTGCESEYQDACAIDAGRGIAAIADGVADSVFPRRWAALLSLAAVQNPPFVNDAELLTEWLKPLRRIWKEEVNLLKSNDSLSWNQEAKLLEKRTASSTLLWVEFSNEDDQASDTAIRYCSYAVGDCCLFHVRDNQLLKSFPITDSKELDLDPSSIESSRRSDSAWQFKECEGFCEPGDWIVLATDAVAGWILSENECKARMNWELLWSMTRQDFEKRIAVLRENGQIRFDDSTLVLLQIGQPRSGTHMATRLEGTALGIGSLSRKEVDVDATLGVDEGRSSTELLPFVEEAQRKADAESQHATADDPGQCLSVQEANEQCPTEPDRPFDGLANEFDGYKEPAQPRSETVASKEPGAADAQGKDDTDAAS